MISRSTEKFAAARYFLLRHSPRSPSIRYFGVRLNSVVPVEDGLQDRAHVVRRTDPIPSDIRKGMYLRVGPPVLPDLPLRGDVETDEREGRAKEEGKVDDDELLPADLLPDDDRRER